jgi:hypothetical protein
MLAVVLGATLPLYLIDDASEVKTVVALTIVLSVCALVLSSGIRVPDLGASVTDVAIAGFALSYGLALAVATLNSSKAPAINYLYPFLLPLIAFMRWQPPRALWYTAYLSLCIVVGFGWYRFLTGTGGDELEHLLGYWGVKYTSATRNNDVMVPLLASMIALLLLESGVTSWRVRVTNLALLVPSVLAVVFSYSRAAWLALSFFAALLFWLNRGSRRSLPQLMMYGTGIVAGIVTLVWTAEFIGIDVSSLWIRLLSVSDSTIESTNLERWELLKYAFQLGMENPLIGAGAGRFACCMAEFGFHAAADALHPENLIANVHAEMGVVAALTLTWALASSIVRGAGALTVQYRAAAFVLAGLLLWLQFNSELLSLFTWTVLGMSVRLTSP